MDLRKIFSELESINEELDRNERAPHSFRDLLLPTSEYLESEFRSKIEQFRPLHVEITEDLEKVRDAYWEKICPLVDQIDNLFLGSRKTNLPLEILDAMEKDYSECFKLTFQLLKQLDDIKENLDHGTSDSTLNDLQKAVSWVGGMADRIVDLYDLAEGRISRNISRAEDLVG